MTIHASTLAGMAIPHPNGGKSRNERARERYATNHGAQHHASNTPFVVEFCPSGEWAVGATFGWDDVRRGLEALEVDGVRAEAWPCGMRFSRDGYIMEIKRTAKGILILDRGAGG